MIYWFSDMIIISSCSFPPSLSPLLRFRVSFLLAKSLPIRRVACSKELLVNDRLGIFLKKKNFFFVIAV